MLVETECCIVATTIKVYSKDYYVQKLLHEDGKALGFKSIRIARMTYLNL